MRVTCALAMTKGQLRVILKRPAGEMSIARVMGSRTARGIPSSSQWRVGGGGPLWLLYVNFP